MAWACTARAAIGLHVAAQDVLVEADAERVLLEARLSLVTHVGLRLAGPQRLDRLEEEVERGQDVEDEPGQEPGTYALGQVLDHVGAGAEEEDDRVDGGHDDEREAGLVVRKIDEVDRFVEHVGEGPVALPRVDLPMGVLEQLPLLLGQLDRPPRFRLLAVCGRNGHRRGGGGGRRRGAGRTSGRGGSPVFLAVHGTWWFAARHSSTIASVPGRKSAGRTKTNPAS